MEALVAVITGITLSAVPTHEVPVEACFATFNWNDCGRPPQPVMYYWKPGSRCEVGIWKGCLPNMNMFKDEYECVSTCIFTVRAQPPDWHQLGLDDETTPFPDYEDATTGGTDTTGTGETGTGGTGETGTGDTGGTGGTDGSGDTADPAGTPAGGDDAEGGDTPAAEDGGAPPPDEEATTTAEPEAET